MNWERNLAVPPRSRALCSVGTAGRQYADGCSEPHQPSQEICLSAPGVKGLVVMGALAVASMCVLPGAVPRPAQRGR